MPTFNFDPVDLPANVGEFRQEIRHFLRTELPKTAAWSKANSWSLHDEEFSLKLGRRGWIGMVWPKKYGGHERHSIERYILLEELLAAGAPVGAHWIADRQSGPALLKFGSEQQRQNYLPGMARGEIYCCIGMSEPNAGSDLAAVRTRAERLPDGRWQLNGQKIWTTLAHKCQLMIGLFRTGPAEQNNRHAGLTQFLIELKNPGIEVRPIVDLVGATHFNEVFFRDAIVDSSCVLGTEGQGWTQVVSELSLERSGPERFLSSFALYLEWLRLVGQHPAPEVKQTIGRVAAELWTLRQMSLSVAGQLARGRDPSLEAAVVKDLGNSFEQQLPVLAQTLAEANVRLEGDDDFARTLALLLQTSTSFSLRGGAREILRGIVARGLGLR